MRVVRVVTGYIFLMTVFYFVLVPLGLIAFIVAWPVLDEDDSPLDPAVWLMRVEEWIRRWMRRPAGPGVLGMTAEDIEREFRG